MKCARIIGEKEKAVESVKFDFLGLYRPAVVLGNSNMPGVLGYVMPLVHWAMQSKYRSIHKNDIARAMVAQSEQALLAIRAGQISQEQGDREDPAVQRDGALLRQRGERRALSISKLLCGGLKRCACLPALKSFPRNVLDADNPHQE